MMVRSATISDFPALYELAGLLHEKQIDEVDLRQQVERILAEKNRTILVAEDENGVVVGALVLNLVYKLSKNECRLDEVIVSEAARGKGVGKALLAAADAWAWQYGADTIEFTSRPTREAANALYQSTGYELRQTNVYAKKRGS